MYLTLVRMSRASAVVRLLHHRDAVLSSAQYYFKMGNLGSKNYSKNETPSQPLPDNEFRKLSETEWKQKLTPEQYHVCREKGTETPFTGAYVNTKQEGLYTCVACGAPVFESETKFDSGSGWPSFYQQYKENDGNQSVLTKDDQSLGMVRTEVLCAQCDSHLGHVFPDGPQPTGQRYCINSAALNFKPKTPESK